MKHGIHTFMVESDTCQHNKGETVKALGTLQLLTIPPIIWMDISRDFIVGLPKSGNKSVIMVVVDRISKYFHLCALQHPFTTSIVAQFFMIISSNSMECLILLSSIVIQLLTSIFSKN